MAQISQYFKVMVSSPKEAKKQVSMDLTDYIEAGLKITDEDGLIKECSFDLKDGFLMMDVLSIGMKVDIVGGDLSSNENLFSGFIKSIEPDFMSNGDVELKIVCYSDEGNKLGVAVKDLVYPSTNHPETWATKELMYSDIITNLAKSSGIVVRSSNIKVLKDIKASLKTSVRQKNMTDWAFMQMLSRKINCTMWTTEGDGQTFLHLIDDRSVVNKIGNYTFFFLARKNSKEFMEFEIVSDKQIQVISAKIKLDTQNNKGSFKQTTDPNTGETKVTTDRPILNENGEDTGEIEKWVLDEAKVRGLSFEARNELIELFMSGKITWEGGNGSVSAKNYFKKVVIDSSSREGISNNTEVEVAGSDLNKDGITSKNPTGENTGSKSYKTVIDEAKLKKLSAEKRSAIMGRIVRGEITDADKEYYKVVDTTPKDDKDDADKSSGKTQDTQSSVDKSKSKKVEANTEKQKRDAGFNITCRVYGNLNIKPRKSYIIEGLGKYSGSYYLYKIVHEFGTSGYVMELIFTK